MYVSVADYLTRHHNYIIQTVKSDAQEKESLQAKLAEMDSKLVAAEMGNSEAISGADSFKATLEHQFAENISEYKVRLLF